MVLLCASACGDGANSTRNITLTAFAGDVPDPGALVVVHSATGEVVENLDVDASGRVALSIEPDLFITTWFRWTPRIGSEGVPLPETRQFAVTMPAPHGDAVIYGPVPELPPVGTLEVAVDGSIPASRYLIETGCERRVVDTLPASFEITSHCLGSDLTVDVLVRALDAANRDVGYAAGSAELAGATASFNATAWEVDADPVRLVLEDVDPVVRVALVADGREIDDDVIHAAGVNKDGSLWRGLTAENMFVRGFLYSDGTTGLDLGGFVRSMNGLTNELVIRRSDFLMSAPTRATVDIDGAPTMTWREAPIGVDVVVHTVQLDALSWNVVVPLTAGTVTLPMNLGVVESGEVGWTRSFDSTELDGFNEAAESGFHFESAHSASDLILLPRDGTVRSARGTY